jgi:predicted flap endonuclease-1-like 5' DNA nuclease
MSYLIVQTFALLLAAALLGALLAWYLTRMVAANDHAALHARLRAAERDAGALQERLSEAERTGESLAARLAAAEDALVACRTQCAESTAAAAVAPAAASASLGAADPQVQEGMRPPPAPAGDGQDDLQQIKGIGPKIAATLRQLGIGRFEQIAAWTPEHVAWVNAHLRFKGRVEREEWIAQARNLAAQSAGD